MQRPCPRPRIHRQVEVDNFRGFLGERDWILADDLGWAIWGDLGCFESLHFRTPNLDRVAAGIFA